MLSGLLAGSSAVFLVFRIALDVRRFLCAVCDRGHGAGRLQPARRRGLHPGHRIRHSLLQLLRNLVNILGIPSSPNFAMMDILRISNCRNDETWQSPCLLRDKSVR